MLDPNEPAGWARSSNTSWRSRTAGAGGSSGGGGGGVSFSSETNTAPRRRIERKQTGVWDSGVPAGQGGAGGGGGAGVSFAEGVKSGPSRRIVRQQTGPGTVPSDGVGVSFSPETNTAPRRRIERKQTGVWNSGEAVGQADAASAQLEANDAGLQRKLALELQQANQPHTVEGLEQQQRQQLRIVRQQVAELRAELGHD
jgi:hypothetical protein